MLYLGTGGGGFNGIRLIGSKDGIHWDLKSDTLLAAIHSDHHNTVVYDPRRDEYVMYLRAKDIYWPRVRAKSRSTPASRDGA